MNADERRYKHKDITEKTIGVFYEVYKELGCGFLESVYRDAMFFALSDAGLLVAREVPVPVWFRTRKIGTFYADILVNNSVLVELKAARTLDSSHEAQILNYLRATEIEVGLLLNFGPRPQVRRFAFDNDRKGICVHLRSSAAGEE